MKTLSAYIHRVDRSYLILAAFVLLIALHTFGCAKTDAEMPVEIPADEMTMVVEEPSGPPAWAPANADRRSRFYFLPEIDVYYDTHVGQYVYLRDGVWVYGAVLPTVYAEFDLFSAHIVFLDYTVVRPWARNAFYVNAYPVTFFYGHPGLHRGYGWRCFHEHGHAYGGKHIHIKNHNKVYFAGGKGHGNFKPHGWKPMASNGHRGSGPSNTKMNGHGGGHAQHGAKASSFPKPTGGMKGGGHGGTVKWGNSGPVKMNGSGGGPKMSSGGGGPKMSNGGGGPKMPSGGGGQGKSGGSKGSGKH